MTIQNTITQIELTELQRCEETIQRGLHTFVEVGNALLTIRDNRLYRAEWGTFEDYCRERWGMARNYANKLIASAEVVQNLGTIVPILPATESQARPLTSLPVDVRPIIWQQVVETAPNGKVTAAHVQEVVNAYRPHVAQNSGNNEWYTPADYIEAARKVLGTIDVDPASSAKANEVVQAKRYYTVVDNGLTKDWPGRVWLNPPYASGLIEAFITHLGRQVKGGTTIEAIVLVNNATETQWFQTLVSLAAAVVFPSARIRFWGPDGVTGAPLQGQAFLYIGERADTFLSHFKGYGWGAKL